MHHPAEAAVAQGERLEPLARRLAVPERVPSRGGLLAGGQPPERPLHPDLQAVASAGVVVLEPEGVLAGVEVDGSVLADHAVRPAVLDHERAVHEQPRTVVADGMEAILARPLDGEVSFEHEGEVVDLGAERDRDVVRLAGGLGLEGREVRDVRPVAGIGLPADRPCEGKVPCDSGTWSGEGGQEDQEEAHRGSSLAHPAAAVSDPRALGPPLQCPPCWV